MKHKAIRIWTITSLLVLALVLVLGQGNVVYGRSRGLSPARYRALPAPARAVADVARADLASQFGLAVDRVVVLGVDPTNFEDSSLGVIEPGKRYLEAATPGYIARFSVSGRPHTYHGSDGRVVRIPAGEEAPAAVQRLLWLSVSDLRDRLEIGLDEVVVQSVEATEFPDGSLGAPEPNVPFPLAPTPGYEIRLQAKGVAYRYWAAGERTVYVGSNVEPSREVTLYLHRDLVANGGQCRVVYPVRRMVAVSPEASGVLVLRQLFAGPTEDEIAQGYASPFIGATADMLLGIQVEERTAFVDLAGVPLGVLPNDDCAREAFTAEVDTTLKMVLPVEWVVYSIDGDLRAGCAWMQRCE
jgi:hypothetical protein